MNAELKEPNSTEQEVNVVTITDQQIDRQVEVKLQEERRNLWVKVFYNEFNGDYSGIAAGKADNALSEYDKRFCSDSSDHLK